MLTVFQFDSQEVRFVDGKPVAIDVARVLGYKDPASTITKKISGQNKMISKLQTRGGVQSVFVLEEAGVLQLVTSSRLPNAIDIANQLGLFVLNCKHEQESVRIIKSAFKDLNPIEQFEILDFRIDLYLAAANIAIECDENGHKNSTYASDLKRERAIKSVLGCSFVRYNPNQVGFNVGDVICKIRELV